MSKVTMIMGFPASGKSTLTKQFTAQGAISLNRDTEGGSIADLLPKLESHLKSNQNVVLDNLFPTIASRKPFIDMCRAYNIGIECQVMDTSIEDAQFNAIQRMISLKGKFLMPEEIKKVKHPNIFPPLVLFKYRKEFQKPSIEEGFSKVTTIPFVRQDDKSFTNKALILDYDGTLRECVNGNGKFPTDKNQIEIKPKRNRVLRSYLEQGYKLLGISNQSGVAKGDLTHDKAVELFDHTNRLLNIDIEYQFCPHQSTPISCWCRKPMPGYGVEFIFKHKLKAKDCIFVGDMTTDKTFAARCGFQYVDQAEFFK